MVKKLFHTVLIVLVLSDLAACSGQTGAGEKETVKIGVTGTDGQYWAIIKEKAVAEGIEIELIEFSDYTLPNQALAQGEIDLNAFQHIAFLNQFTEEHNLDIVPIGTTVIAPMGLYSSQYDDVNEIPKGAKIAIPDDPSNQARALKLLESAGLIKLKEDFGLFGELDDIEENTHDLEIIPMTAQQTPRVL